jgi:hypothetical protein
MQTWLERVMEFVLEISKCSSHTVEVRGVEHLLVFGSLTACPTPVKPTHDSPKFASKSMTVNTFPTLRDACLK